MILRRGIDRGKLGREALDGALRVHDLAHRYAGQIELHGERLGEQAGIASCDACPAAGTDLDLHDALRFERSQRIAHHDPADPETPGKVLLGTEEIAGPKFFRKQRLAHPTHDLGRHGGGTQWDDLALAVLDRRMRSHRSLVLPVFWSLPPWAAKTWSSPLPGTLKPKMISFTAAVNPRARGVRADPVGSPPAHHLLLCWTLPARTLLSATRYDAPMFVNFFHELKAAGVPVTLREYLTLMEAMEKDLAGRRVEDFYYLSRTALVKDERNLDKFDRVFGQVFKGLELMDRCAVGGDPGASGSRSSPKNISPKTRRGRSRRWAASISCSRRCSQRLEEQQGRHQGGNKWIGTAGTSPFGAYGYNPEGVRIGQDEGRNFRAVKVWDQREFKNLDDQVELGTRNIKVALRRLRRFARRGARGARPRRDHQGHRA